MSASPETLGVVKELLSRTLQLGDRAATMQPETALLGNIENQRLQTLVAELSLDKAMLDEAAKGNF